MPITIRHDAAAVVPPSNQSTRKYGQQLVLQQNQQKYAAQQQGYDRLFTLGRDAMQNRNQAIMQGQQNAARAIMNATQFANDQTLQETQNKFRQQQAEAEQQAKFMEDARKQSTGMIMDDIKNENYDPATARKLQQNLVAESEALGNPQLDATQRAEALAKIRAERAMLTASRIEKPPRPTAQEQFDQGIVTGPNGTQYRMNSKGDFDPLEQQQKPPQSANEAFQADPKMRKQYVDEATKELTDPETGKLPDREKANARAMELYDIDQKSFNPQPTEMPGLPPTAPATPGTERSILEQEPSNAPPLSKGFSVEGTEQSILEISPDQQAGLEAAYHTDMTSKGYKLVTPSDGGRPYYSNEQPSAPTQPAAPSVASPEQGVPPSPVPAQNPWKEVANPPKATSVEAPAPIQAQAPVSQQSTPTPTPATKAQAPNFTSMIAGTKDVEERRVLGALQGMYGGQPPEVQSAIGVILNDQSSLADLKAANDYLRSVGIDIDQLAKYQHQGGSRKGKKK